MCEAFVDTDINKLIYIYGFAFILRSNIPDLD